jgi:hypothetical protein
VQILAASSSSSPGNSAYIFLIFIVIVVAIRLRRVIYGTRVSAARTIGYSVFYAAFGAFFIGSSFFLGVPVEYAALYAALAAIAAYLSYLFADKRIWFWKGSDGGIYYKGGVIIYLIYLAALVARIAVDILLIGPAAFSFSIAPEAATPTELLGFTLTDSMLMFGVGLLIGRNARVYKRYQNIVRGTEQLPSEAAQAPS